MQLLNVVLILQILVNLYGLSAISSRSHHFSRVLCSLCSYPGKSVRLSTFKATLRSSATFLCSFCARAAVRLVCRFVLYCHLVYLYAAEYRLHVLDQQHLERDVAHFAAISVWLRLGAVPAAPVLQRGIRRRSYC